MRRLKSSCVESPPIAPQTLAMSKSPKTRRRLFIAEWRKARGLTQEQLADAAGMTAGNLSPLERGKINYTQVSLEAIATALAVEVEDLFRDPADAGAEIFSLARAASPDQRRRIAELAKVFLKAPQE